MYPGFVFRFKILPFLKERVLPLYEDILKKNSNVIFLGDDEQEYLRKFSNFLSEFSGQSFIIKKELDVYSSNVLFEMMQKIINVFMPILNKISVSDIEKQHVLNNFHSDIRPYLLHVLS